MINAVCLIKHLQNAEPVSLERNNKGEQGNIQQRELGRISEHGEPVFPLFIREGCSSSYVH